MFGWFWFIANKFIFDKLPWISSFVVFCFDCSDFDVEIWCYFSRSMQIPWNGVSLISFRNFRHPRYSFLIFFSIYLCCYYTFIVQNDFCLKTFQDLHLLLTLCLGENYLNLQIRHLVETYSFCCICRQQIVYRMEGSLVLLLHFQFLLCVCQLILPTKDHLLRSHLFVCKNVEYFTCCSKRWCNT